MSRRTEILSLLACLNPVELLEFADEFGTSMERIATVIRDEGRPDYDIEIQAFDREFGGRQTAIPFIKAIRAATGWGLRESKEVLDDTERGMTRILHLSLPRLDAERLQRELTALGASCYFVCRTAKGLGDLR